MPNVQIRDVPDEVLALLHTRARDRGQSLQVFLTGVLTAEAGVALNDALLDEAAREATYRPGDGETAEFVRALRADRDAQLAPPV